MKTIFFKPLTPDADLRNADWLKQTSWDLGQWDDIPLTEKELKKFLQLNSSLSLEEFKKLPAYLGWKYVVSRSKAGKREER